MAAFGTSGTLGGTPVVPAAGKGDNATIFDSTATTGAQTPLTANWKAGSVLDLGHSGRCALTIKYDAHASSTANQLKFLIFVSNAATAPLITDDEWCAPALGDATPTDGVLTDTMLASVDMTVTPAWGEVVIRPVTYSLKAMTTGTDKQREGMVLDVRSWKYLCILAKEEGDTTNVGVAIFEAALGA